MAVDVVDAPVSQADRTLGRRLKTAMVALTILGVAAVLVANQYWDYLGRITVTPARSGDVITAEVESLSHRPGMADLTAVAETTTGRVLRIQADVPVPSDGSGRATFDFTALLQPGEHIATFKVKK